MSKRGSRKRKSGEPLGPAAEKNCKALKKNDKMSDIRKFMEKPKSHGNIKSKLLPIFADKMAGLSKTLSKCTTNMDLENMDSTQQKKFVKTLGTFRISINNQKSNLFSNLPKENEVHDALNFRDIQWLEVQYNPTKRPKDIESFIEEYNAAWKKLALSFNFGLMQGQTRGTQRANHHLDNLWATFNTQHRILNQTLKLKTYCSEISLEDDSDETDFEECACSGVTISANKARILVGLIGLPENDAIEFKMKNDMGKFKILRADF